MDTTAPSKQELAVQASSWATKAREVRIRDAESYIATTHLLRSIKGIRADIQAWFAPHVEAAMETKRKAESARKGLTDERDRVEAPLVDAETVVKRALLTWETEQECLRIKEQNRLQAEAQKQADALVLDAAAALELEATATGNEEMLDEAHALLAQPSEAPVVSVAKFMPKVEGLAYRDQWKAHDAIDLKALARAVADGLAPVTFLLPNMSALHNYARATKGEQPVPGVKFWNDRQIAARR